MLTDLRKRALKGDDLARGDLLTRIRTISYRFVHRRLGSHPADEAFAEDVASEVILQVHRSLEDARARTDRELAGWVLSITRNVAVDLARREWLGSNGAAGSYSVEQITSSQDLGPTVDADALLSVVFEIHDALSAEVQTILWLRLVEGASWDEIALSLGKSMYAVRRQYQRAQQRLRINVLQRIDSLSEAERNAALRYLEALGIRVR